MNEKMRPAMDMPPDISTPHLDDILLDRSAVHPGHAEKGLEQKDYSWFIALDVEGQTRAKENITMLSSLNGHRGADLRRVAAEGGTPESVFIKNLYDWSLWLSAGEHVSGEIIAAPVPESLSGATSATLYERLAFLEKYPNTPRDMLGFDMQAKVASTLGAQGDKWVDTIDPLFNNPRLMQDLIERVGFIPEELFTKKKFKSVEPAKIITALSELRKLESGPLSHEALRARSRLLNHFFISRRAESLRLKNKENISLDTNGIKITLAGLHSHLPYGLIDEATIAELRQGNWITEGFADEMEIRKGTSNNEISTISDAKERQSKQFAQQVGCDKEQFMSLAQSGKTHELAERIVSGNLIVPDGWIETSETKAECSALVSLAEEIVRQISGEELAKEFQDLSEYDVSRAAQETFEIYSKILNSPDYYNAAKLVQAFLKRTPQSSSDGEYAVFRGSYKKSKEGDQYSFVGSLSAGNLSRVLINERKHIPPHLRYRLEDMPIFDRPAYESLESALLVFNTFSASLVRMEKVVESDPRQFIELSQNCLHFLLNNFSEEYNAAALLYEKLCSEEPFNATVARELLSIANKARTGYSSFLYKNLQDQQSFENHFSPEVRIHDVTFGEEFVRGAEAACPSRFDPELSKALLGARMVSLDYRLEDPSETIPFHVEESCLDALRINRERPLINIIGGCKHLDTGENPLETLSEAVVNVAHKHKANVGVPGTQSGIGTVFGMQNVHYGAHFEHLPYAERAHFFSINPGGSVYFPGNPFLDAGSGSIYANSTVDTLVTPVPAEWSKKGHDKYTSKYITHIAYMEALYHRMSIGQKHVMVVGNGGLYSVMEVNESLKRNASLMLVHDTGRFAEAASILIPHLSSIVTGGNPDARILEILQSEMDKKTFDEFITKDFGRDSTPENEDYGVFRDYFMKFLRLALEKAGHVSTVTLSSLEQSLDQALENK